MALRVFSLPSQLKCDNDTGCILSPVPMTPCSMTPQVFSLPTQLKCDKTVESRGSVLVRSDDTLRMHARHRLHFEPCTDEVLAFI